MYFTTNIYPYDDIENLKNNLGSSDLVVEQVKNINSTIETNNVMIIK